VAARGSRPDRRRFLKHAGVGLAAPSLLTTGALGAPDQAPASERVVAALVGCGGRGSSLLGIHGDPRCTVAAVCDVDQHRVAAARKRIGKCDAYGDFRRVLDRKDIDAVLVATPDHWHAPVEMTVRYEFADPPFEMIWEQPGTGKLNLEFLGTEATLSGFWNYAITRGEADLSPTRADEPHLEESDSHSGNWLEMYRHAPPPGHGRRDRPSHNVFQPPGQHRLPHGPQAALGPRRRAVPRRRGGEPYARRRLPRAVAGVSGRECWSDGVLENCRPTPPR